MLLRELLEVCNVEELTELYSFWNGDGELQRDRHRLQADLNGHMTDVGLVRHRLRFLSPRLVDLLRFFLGRRRFESSMDSIRRSQTFSFMSPHEVEAAVRALIKRGFLFPRSRSSDWPGTFVVAEELGVLMRGQLEDLDLDLGDAFSLRRMLTSHNGALDGQELCAKAAIHGRIEELEASVRCVFDRALTQGYGLLPRAVLQRRAEGEEAIEFPRRDIKEKLEGAFLGTVRHLALGEYGINHFDDVVIVFEEVLRAHLECTNPATLHPGATPRSLGVDLFSDLSHLLQRLSREQVRLTQAGSVYRTAARKIEEQLILASKGHFEAKRLFRFLLDLALTRHLVRRSDDRFLVLTAKGKTWPRLSVAFKLKELLAAVMDEGSHTFHRPRLKRLSLEVLKELDLDRWYDFGLVVGLVRHHYLSRLDEEGIREAYQGRYQYSSEAHMRDLPQLTQIVAKFISHELHILGLVDLLWQGDRPVGLKLSPLAATALGKAAEKDAGHGRLLVNPDFEILVFPEGNTYEIIQRLDRFSERVNQEDSHRFRITPRSVERAVASGMTAAEILEVLSENSRSELPQNVVFSIRDYSEKVRFVSVQRAYLVTARHKEVIDALLRHPAIRAAVQERIAPRMLALNPQANLEEILPLLEQEGIFLEGDSPWGEE